VRQRARTDGGAASAVATTPPSTLASSGIQPAAALATPPVAHTPAPAAVRSLGSDLIAQVAPAPAPASSPTASSRQPNAPSTPPESGWSSRPPPMPAPDSIPVLEVVPDPFPASSAPPPVASVPPVAVVPHATLNEGAVESLAAHSAPLVEVEAAPAEALSEDDLMEISSEMLESVPPPPYEVAPVVPSYNDEPPASSQRSRIVPADLHSSLSASDEPLDEEREVPLKTPPPESGPQEAPLAAAYAEDTSEVDQLLEADLPPVAAHHSLSSPFDTVEAPFRSMPSPGPTPEQLGQTIELEEGTGPELELAPPRAPSEQPRPEELEMPLPSPEAGGRYDDSLLPPPEAEQDLQAHMVREEEETIGRYPAGTSPMDYAAAMAADGSEAAQASAIVERPAISQVTVHEIKPNLSAEQAPRSFLALLDASLRLGG